MPYKKAVARRDGLFSLQKQEGNDVDWSLMFHKRVMVFGCGNILKGDDGLGPAVVRLLEEQGGLPDEVGLLDIGTSIREVLLDMLLMDPKPARIIVVDAVTEPSRNAGEFWEIDVDMVSPKKVKDFSLHQFPSVNLLKDLKETTGMDVRILVVQTGCIPDEIDDRLTPEVTAVLPRVADRVRELCLLP
ncbi:hydrogenase maturation protease [Desulfolutivibrio sulfoxidireducens]|uniref:hydrogenase maturation protease n=1 Tax=Desulfolutivibrio sulfoxidireducens TaxID=2773299 RepID=UPI001FE77DF9|nr:hydrogenase maturation protease [Desulfolutivibrio sulfoxidireducens]